MSTKKQGNEPPINPDKFNSYQPNLFGDKTDITKLRVFEKTIFSGEQLFGKADAFMEDLDILKGYAVERSDCDDFYDYSKPLVLVCAAKGMGKTTLFKLWEDKLAALPNCFTLVPNYTDITGFNGMSDFAELSSIWKRKLFTHILIKITSGNIAANQIMSRVEMAESKMKKTNIFDFLASSVVAYDRDSNTNHIEQINELKERRNWTTWIFLDEFDADFTREVSSINKMAALLNAARDLTTEFLNIKIRISIRPNVWASLRNSNALMSNFKELMMPMEWTPSEIKTVLAKRIECYLKKQKSLSGLNWDLIEFSEEEKENWLMSQVFDTEKFDLGKGNRPTEIVLAKLCADRPRWVIELCKAATKAKKNRPGVLLFKDVSDSFKEIGATRHQDIVSEYNIYCPKISDILNAFYNARYSYTLLDLISYIEAEITSKTDIEILGISKRCTARQVANFLYELTFIEPKKILSKHKNQHEFLHYKDFPDLIKTSVINENIQSDLYWIVHPAFRNYLNMGIPSNNEFEN